MTVYYEDMDEITDHLVALPAGLLVDLLELCDEMLVLVAEIPHDELLSADIDDGPLTAAMRAAVAEVRVRTRPMEHA